MTDTATQDPDATVGTANDIPADDVTIYIAKDYDRFDYLIGNRPINEAKVSKIIQDIKEKGINITKYSMASIDFTWQCNRSRQSTM